MKIRLRRFEDFAIGFESVKNGKLIPGAIKWVLYLGFVSVEVPE